MKYTHNEKNSAIFLLLLLLSFVFAGIPLAAVRFAPIALAKLCSYIFFDKKEHNQYHDRHEFIDSFFRFQMSTYYAELYNLR